MIHWGNEKPREASEFINPTSMLQNNLRNSPRVQTQSVDQSMRKDECVLKSQIKGRSTRNVLFYSELVEYYKVKFQSIQGSVHSEPENRLRKTLSNI